MAPFSKMSSRSRQSALAVIMLAVLLVGTAAAWLIARRSGGPQPGEQWYVIFDGDKIVGWDVVQRQPIELGGTGYQVQGGGSTQSDDLVSSRWQLNEDATKGSYVSALPVEIIRGGQAWRLTRIDYDRQTLQIRQDLQAGQERQIGQVDEKQVGPEYIPEGRLRPTIVETAKSGQARIGTMVYDRVGKLIPLQIRPLETTPWMLNGQEADLTEVAVTWGTRRQRLSDQRYYVAEDGSVPLIRILAEDGSERVRYQLASFEQVRLSFPDAPALRSRALVELDDQ